MGRFTSVQTYSDTAADKRTVAYEQASGGGDSGNQKLVKPEKVVNPYGSTAGAGSGEFHVYRAARAREMQRQASILQTADLQEKDREFAMEQQLAEKECQERTAKRKAKRKKQKEAKERKLNLEKAGISVSRDKKEKITVEEDEFQYVPEKDSVAVESAGKSKETDEHPEEEEADDLLANDGSFLERMKKKLKASQNGSQGSSR